MDENKRANDEMDVRFLSAGYTVFPSSPWSRADYIYQKCAKDSRGKKYYITVERYPPIPDSRVPASAEFTAQFCDAVTNNPMNLRLFGNWEIPAAEERIEMLFQVGNGKIWRHYEEYGEDDG